MAVGLGFFVGVWAILAKVGGQLPDPASTFDAAVKIFSDPFYKKGPNDQGIGWNVLTSLGRVGLGFGMAALVGIPLGFMLGRFRFLSDMASAHHQHAAAGEPARVAPDRPADLQGGEPRGDLRHLHLQSVADDHQHRRRRAPSAAGLPQRRARAESFRVESFQQDPVSSGAALHDHRCAPFHWRRLAGDRRR